MIAAKAKRRFYSEIDAYLGEFTKDINQFYDLFTEYKLHTPIGTLTIHLYKDSEFCTIHSKWDKDDIRFASEHLSNINQCSGKWNHHLSDNEEKAILEAKKILGNLWLI